MPVLDHGDLQQIHHVARLAVLAMCARGVAGAEFETSPEIHEVRFTVFRGGAGELPVDVEFLDNRSNPIGGMSV